MGPDTVGLLDKADLAVAASRGVVEDARLESMAVSARNARIRLSYPEDMLVVALVGGTGSGKSSLLNALCEAEIADVGGVRPTTGAPIAVAPAARREAIDGFLDELGVTIRKTHDVADWLCLIDMPDTDSVELDHRLQVEALLPRIDVIVWVLDPEKYRDAALHDRYLKTLSAYAGQFLFVLNQVDRLDPTAAEAVVADLSAALVEDGLESSRITVTAASPAAGPPIGVSDLFDSLADLAGGREEVFDKLLVDLEGAASRLLSGTGGRGLDFEDRAESALQAAIDDLVVGDDNGAIDRLARFLETIASEAGGRPGERMRQLAASVPAHIRDAAEELVPATTPVQRRRFRIRRKEPSPSPDGAARREMALSKLRDALVAPAREILSRRAQANAALTDLALSVESVRARTRR